MPDLSRDLTLVIEPGASSSVDAVRKPNPTILTSCASTAAGFGVWMDSKYRLHHLGDRKETNSAQSPMS